MDAADIRDKLRPFLDTIKDEGTNNDSGFGMGVADIHVTVGGVEYVITIKKSGAEAVA